MANPRNLRWRLLGCLTGVALLAAAVWYGVTPPPASLPGPGAIVEVSEVNEFEPYPMPAELVGVDLLRQTAETMN